MTDAEAVTQPVPRPRVRGVAMRALRWLGLAAAWYYVLCVLLLVVFRFLEPPITGVQLERRIEALASGERHEERMRWVALDQLPKHVSRAVVAAEDGRFYQHSGYDFREMKEAGGAVFDGELPRGASTITQQLVKNLFGCTCRNPLRKVYDLALATPAELILGKERILELYLNNVEWGPGVFGVGAAARYHFGVDARELTRTQSAGLAALLPNPLRRTPRNTPEYRAEILRRMDFRGW